MNDRELLDVLATPEPDYHDDPGGWQRWRDKTTEALLAVRGRGPSQELTPTFAIRAFLDGDDLPATQTENVQAALVAAANKMHDDRLVVGYTIELMA